MHGLLCHSEPGAAGEESLWGFLIAGLLAHSDVFFGERQFPLADGFRGIA